MMTPLLGMRVLLMLWCVAMMGNGSHVQAQGSLQEEEIPRWLARLGEGEPGDNNAATAALISMGQPVIPYLLDVLKPEPAPFQDRSLLHEHWARLRAAHCLSTLAYPGTAELLTREIQRDPHPGMRLIYAIYLIRHDVSRAIEALVTDLGRAEYTLRDIVITLTNINDRRAIPLLEPLLADSRPEVQLAAAEVLVSLGAESGEPVLLSQLENPKTRLRAAFLLPVKYKQMPLPILREALEDDSAQIRLKAAERLADMGEPDGFEVLLDALQREPEPWQRGSDMPLHEVPRIADRVIALVGHPDTYDPMGTPALRDAVIARWRRRFRAEGHGFLKGLQPRHPMEGRQDADLGDLHLSRDMSDMRTLFFLAGRKIYELGTMDGGFPPIGRLLGDQGGIWAHPVKLLDGYRFTVLEEDQPEWRLTESRHFAHRFYAARFHFERHDLSAVREDFTAEAEPALFTQLTLRNKTRTARQLQVQFSAWVNIRPAWRAGLPNDVDEVRIENGLVTAFDRQNSLGRAVFGANRRPQMHDVADNVVTLTYIMDLPAEGEETLPFLILAGLPDDQTGTHDAFVSIMARRDALLAEKEAVYTQTAFGGVQFRCSDQRVTEAFQLAKLNLHMLTADLRPQMPAPYFHAGIPYYTQLFGCDNFLSIPGATAAGFTEAARGTLECLAEQGRGQQGRIPHEVATSNRLVGDGNAQEPPQFVLACRQYVLWTGDTEFQRRVYPVCQQVLEYCRGKLDEDGYLQGPALIESPGMGSQKLDAACYLHAAYAAAAEMATELGETAHAREYAGFAEAFEQRFSRDWWMPEQRLWADSRLPGGERRMSNYWSVVFPLLTGLAEPQQAQVALEEIERGWVNQWGGVHTRQRDISGQGSGVVTSNLFAMAAFQYGHADLGWRLVEQASRAPLEERMLGGFNEVIPPGGSDILQLWSAAPLLGAVIEGLAGVRPNAAAHRVVLRPQIPSALTSVVIEQLRIGDHRLSLEFERQEQEQATHVVHCSGTEPLTCVFQASIAAGETVFLNDREVQVRPHASPIPGHNEITLEFTLKPGSSARVWVGATDAGNQQ